MRNQRNVAIAVVVGVVALSAMLGEAGTWTISSLAYLGSGLFAGVAVVSLFVYRERRDPALLLVGIGTATYTTHRIVVDALSRSSTSWPWTQAWFNDIAMFATITGLLVLTANLVMVVPWADRRGRPPLTPGRVVLASVLGFLVLDLLAAVTSAPWSFTDIVTAGPGLTTFGWLEALALVLAGSISAVRANGWGGRFVWIAAAALSLAIFGATPILTAWTERESAQIAISNVGAITPTMAATFLLTFVLASIQLESARMRRATDRAEEVLTGRAEIAAMVAHDVRGPLGTMKGLATTVRKSYEQLGDEERLEFIGMIERESTRLLGLADHIALALRVDARTLDLQLRPQSLAPLVRQAIEARDLSAHPLDLDAIEDVVASADAKWLPVAVGEALDNASRFSLPDAPIGVRLRTDGARATIEIEDRGPGVPPDRREEIFMRFARWRPPGYEDRSGSGLGLFICRGICREHGGEASLVDGPEGGTILRIELPLEGMGSG